MIRNQNGIRRNGFEKKGGARTMKQAYIKPKATLISLFPEDRLCADGCLRGYGGPGAEEYPQNTNCTILFDQGPSES